MVVRFRERNEGCRTGKPSSIRLGLTGRSQMSAFGPKRTFLTFVNAFRVKVTDCLFSPKPDNIETSSSGVAHETYNPAFSMCQHSRFANSVGCGRRDTQIRHRRRLSGIRFGANTGEVYAGRAGGT